MSPEEDATEKLLEALGAFVVGEGRHTYQLTFTAERKDKETVNFQNFSFRELVDDTPGGNGKADHSG